MIAQLISGGQSGVDRAALDVALELDTPCGGWCPKGRNAEDGPIPDHYPLKETSSGDYSQRTEWNVRDSDGTLILAWGEPTGGTLLTAEICRGTGKPYLVIDLADEDSLAVSVPIARGWIADKVAGAVLNVAGPRASEAPTAYERGRAFLRAVLGRGEG